MTGHPTSATEAPLLAAAGREPDSRFGRITRMATRTLAVPVAFIAALEGDRHVLKAAIGVDEHELQGQVTTICELVLSNPGAGIVEDMTTDVRVSPDSGPWGVGDGLALVGHPLLVNGRVVGVLCVLDTRARAFDESELAALIDLAAWAESEFLGEQSRRAVRELRELQRRTDMVLEGVAQGVLGVDETGMVTYANEAAERLLGWPHTALLGHDLHRAIHARRANGRVYPADECPVTQTLATGRKQRFLREVFWRRDGSALPVDWSAGALREGDEVVGAVVVFEDDSGRLESERIKDEFVSVVSHELRTPLTSLRGALDLLVAGIFSQDAPAAEQLVEMAHRNAVRLARLVDDILDLQRSARGALPLARGRVEVGDVFQAALSTVAGMASSSSITLDVGCSGGEIWGDSHRLVQVFTNLLGNAIRFSPPGGTVRLNCTEDPDGLRLTVADEGIGVPENEQHRVFERFWQVDASDTRSRGGSGLGLAIAKDIVEAHAGTITLVSALGQGTTFTVWLPQRREGRPVELPTASDGFGEDLPGERRGSPSVEAIHA